MSSKSSDAGQLTVAPPPRRVANNGRAYTYAEFNEYYCETQNHYKWNVSSPYSAAQESGAIQPAAAPASSQSGDASQLVASNQSSNVQQLAASDPNNHRPEQAEQQRICTMRDVHATPRQKWTAHMRKSNDAWRLNDFKI